MSNDDYKIVPNAKELGKLNIFHNLIKAAEDKLNASFSFSDNFENIATPIGIIYLTKNTKSGRVRMAIEIDGQLKPIWELKFKERLEILPDLLDSSFFNSSRQTSTEQPS